MFMFRHDVKNGIDERNEQPEEAIENNSDANEYVVTTLQSITKSIEKIAMLMKKVAPVLICESCNIEAKNQNGLTMHIKAKHTETKTN